METHYNAFLIRSWVMRDGAARLVVEHVQSGERVAVPSLNEALTWVSTWLVCPPGDQVQEQRATDDSPS